MQLEVVEENVGILNAAIIQVHGWNNVAHWLNR
jgi:hypothetical protein